MSDRKKELLRALKFTLFSISAGLIQILSFTLLMEVFGLKEREGLCHLIALVLSVLWNFTLNRKFTFQSSANVPAAMLKVALFYAVFTPLSTWGVSKLTSIGWHDYLVEGLAMLVNFVLEFVYQRFFVFGKSLDTAKKG